MLVAAGVSTLLVPDARLWFVNTLARAGDYQLLADIAYGQDPRQCLDFYRPPAEVPERNLTLVFIPGGCWGACDTYPKEDYRFIADAFTERGYAVAVINYRLYPQHRFAEIVVDAAAAVDTVASQSGKWGKAGGRLVIMGHSAGAHLAAMLALDARYLAPSTREQLAGWIGFAGPYDFLPFSEHYQPDLFGPEERYADSQPVNFVDVSDPPALLLYGNQDARVKPRNILGLSQRLLQQGVPFQAHCYDGIDHGGVIGALSRPLQDQEPVLADVLTFLQQLEQGEVQPDVQLSRCQPPTT